MDKLAEIDSMDNRLEAALEMFCFIARSQIFLDGNKRVAQLMCNKIMMENDIGIFSVPYDEIDRFKELLLVNPAYVKKDTMSDKTERSPMTMNV